jgi:ClpP class serine protease
LTGPEKTLFSGQYWTAKTALEYGVIDRLIDLRAFLRERYGENVVTPVVAAERSLFGWRKPGVGRLAGDLAGGLAGRLGPERLFDGAGLMDDFISAVESRTIWSRFGL